MKSINWRSIPAVIAWSIVLIVFVVGGVIFKVLEFIIPDGGHEQRD